MNDTEALVANALVRASEDWMHGLRRPVAPLWWSQIVAGRAEKLTDDDRELWAVFYVCRWDEAEAIHKHRMTREAT